MQSLLVGNVCRGETCCAAGIRLQSWVVMSCMSTQSSVWKWRVGLRLCKADLAAAAVCFFIINCSCSCSLLLVKRASFPRTFTYRRFQFVKHNRRRVGTDIFAKCHFRYFSNEAADKTRNFLVRF